MKGNEKIIQNRGEEYSFWVSDSEKCVAFKQIPGYKEVKLKCKKELWELVHSLIDTGYQIQ